MYLDETCTGMRKPCQFHTEMPQQGSELAASLLLSNNANHHTSDIKPIISKQNKKNHNKAAKTWQTSKSLTKIRTER